MKVANNKPQVSKSRTYVTQDCYEVWYSRPVSLGRIDRRNGYWYSADGHRFLSSKDATEYLVKLRDMQFPIRDEVLVRSTVAEPKPVAPTRKAATAAPAPTRKIVNAAGVQTHPKFQEYLRFLDFVQASGNK